MNEFDNLLENVRNSYRLLYSFNRRLLDLMKYIGKRFNIPYAGGWAKFSNPSPGYGKGNLDAKAWDWLNLYFYEFTFVKEEIKFSIIFQADTGRWDSEVDNLEIEKFEKADKSKSKLIFIFSNTEYWDMDQALDDKYLKGEYENEYMISDDGKKKMYCKIYDLNHFQNMKDTDEVLDDFVHYLNKNGVYEIKIIDEL
jgi:hypothetical protein